MLTLLLATVWALATPSTPDLAAQVYRTWLFAQHGFVVWDNAWYGGHHVPGYSLVFPPLASAIGLRLTGVVAVTASSFLFELTLRSLGVRRAGPAAWAFAVCCVGDLLVGRLTYALGVAVGLAAIAALVRGRRYTAVVLAVACAMTSPVAALFLGLACAIVAVAERRRPAVAVAGAAIGTVGILAAAFPEGGDQAFGVSQLIVLVALSAGAALVVAPERRILRLGASAYAIAGVASFVVASPMGANVTRLGTGFLAPLLVASGPRPGRRSAQVFAALLVVALGWQWSEALGEASKGVADASTSRAYYAPLVARLRADPGPPGRLEVPFTRDHWETVFLARDVPLARGWERQLDRRLNPVFYATPTLTPAAYRRWLLRNGVRLVALPDAPMDPAGRAEARLVGRGLPYLRLVWRSAHWRLFRVRSPGALVSGPATLERLGPTTVRLTVLRPGALTLRVHASQYWRLVSGAGCIAGGRDGWTHIRATAPGTIELAARFSVPALFDRPVRC